MGNLFLTKPSTKDMVKMFGIQFILSLITNFGIARALVYTGTFSWVSAISVAIAIWIAFVAVIEGSAIVWEKKPWKLVLINSGLYLVVFIVSAIILAHWR
jgi:hypothetical protein